MTLRSLLSTFLLLSTIYVHSQSFDLKIKSETENHRVNLKKLDVHIDIFGNIATTKMTLTFFNSSIKTLEGELTFPLPDGASISKYALDINGKLREAVPVKKSKATEVFESIEHQNVDPGILEQVAGNNFRTRIYPFLPQDQRTIEITYEQILPSTNGTYSQYHLPFAHKKSIPEFNLEINSYQSTNKPQLIESPDGQLTFSENAQQFTASLHRKDFQPEKSLTINLPKNSTISTVLTQQNTDGSYYFMLNHFQGDLVKPKIWANKIGIIWDNSISGLQRDIKKELQLLQAFVEKKQNLTIDLALLNITYKKAKTFSIKNGDWTALKAYLEDITYDGATDYSQIKEGILTADEYLFFSDGLSTFGPTEFTLKQPVHTINSHSVAAFSTLKGISRKTGGKYINLNSTAISAAISTLFTNHLMFLGIKESKSFSEVYPSLPTEISENISITGISKTAKNKEITLLFGYGNKVEIQKTIPLDYHKTELEVSRIWAQQKIAELDIDYTKNQAEIEAIGQQFGIVTRNTSLIVLKNVRDYIKYDIYPPTELVADYLELKKDKSVELEERKEDLLYDAISQIEELKKWWNTDFTPKKKYPTPTQKPIETPEQTANNNSNPAVQPAPTTPITSTAATQQHGPIKQITGTITSKNNGLPLPGASVLIQGTNTGVSADFDGNYSISVPQNSILVFEYMGYRNSEVKIENQNIINVDLEETPNALQEVVITTAYRQTTSTFTGAPSRISAQDAPDAPDMPLMIEGKAAGVTVTNFSESTFTTKNTTAPKFTTFDVKQDTEYLKAIDSTKNSYQTYLDLRPKYQSTPSFYLDIAEYFYRKEESDTALLILSNLTELELDNAALFKTVAYKLKEYGNYKKELFITKKILEWRPMDAQSHRDYALALLDNNQTQEALDVLYSILTASYSPEAANRDNGIEEVIVTEINNILSLNKKEINKTSIEPKIILDFPVAIRVVINWNKNDTDIDLWITDPNGEQCSYSHKETEIGGRLSSDITRGYGPEQFLLKKAIPGTYKIETNFYGESQLTISGPTTIMAAIFLYYSSGRQERKVITYRDDNKAKTGKILIGEFEF